MCSRGIYLSLFVSSQLEVFASFKRNLLSLFASATLHSQDNFFCGLGLNRTQTIKMAVKQPQLVVSYLLTKHRFCLSTIPSLFSVITSLSYTINTLLTSLLVIMASAHLGRTALPFPVCTESPCVTGASYRSCKTSSSTLGRSPAKQLFRSIISTK